jgi:hypothetical protein
MDGLLRKEECAAKAGMSVRALDLHFQKGTGPRRTFIGGRTYIEEADAFDWIRSRRVREEARAHATTGKTAA